MEQTLFESNSQYILPQQKLAIDMALIGPGIQIEDILMGDYKIHDSTAKSQDSVLLVVDVQEKLIGTISRADTVITNIVALIKTAQIHKIPIVVTEQEKLGETVPQLKNLLERHKTYSPIIKQSFSCCRNEAFERALKATGRKRVLVTGIETHVCVSQTALDLLANDYLVHIITDAASSHNGDDRQIALDRLVKAGSIMTTTEALIFELTASANTPIFRQILDTVKERRKSLE